MKAKSVMRLTQAEINASRKLMTYPRSCKTNKSVINFVVKKFHNRITEDMCEREREKKIYSMARIFFLVLFDK